MIETVFEFGGEGGSIKIDRIKDTDGEKFIYHHNEMDPIDEDLIVSKRDVYDNFEQPFRLVNRYPWYSLCILTIHEDFRSFILDELINTLNERNVEPINLQHSKGNLEIILNARLNFNETAAARWSASKFHNTIPFDF